MKSARRNGVVLISMGIILIMSGMLTACGTKTRVAGVWKSDQYAGPPLRKILVVGISEKPMNRRIFEDRLSEALQEQGVTAVSSYTLLPTNERISEAALRSVVKGNGFDGVIATRLLGVEREETYVPPSTTYYGGGYRPYGGYYGYYGRSYDVVHTPGYTRVDEITSLETKLWEAQGESLIWGMESETFNPKTITDGIASVTKKVAAELRKSGLLAKE